MTDQMVVEDNPHNNNNYSSEFDSLPIPPMDSLFFSENNNNGSSNGNNGITSSENYISDLGFGFGFDDNPNFELTFDDLEDLYLPSENDEFLIPDHGLDSLQPVQVSVSGSLESGASGVSVDRGGSEVEKFLNFSASESDSYDRGGDVARVSSPEFSGCGVVD